MSNNQLRRNLRLLASTSVLACAMIGAPVSVKVQYERPAWHFEAPLVGPGAYRHIPGEPLELDAAALGTERSADTERRKALERLGLTEGTSYEPPVLLTLSQARAASGGGDGDGGGSGGGSGGADGSGEGADSDSDSESAGASGASGSSSGPSSAAGTSGGSFGDVEQVGPSLSEEEEAAAIVNGWQ